jgi:hypothetical protein
VNTEELAINHDFSSVQQCRHRRDRRGLHTLLYATAEMTAMCYSCHAKDGDTFRPVSCRYPKRRRCPLSEGDDGPDGGVSPRAANRPHAGRGELRHSGACSPRYRSEAGPKASVWMGSDEACRGIRFPLARTGSVRSAARAQARLRPNLRARLQLTSSWPPRSCDSRFLPMAMVGGGPFQRIKIYVVDVYIGADFLAPSLQVFRIVKRRNGMAVWRRGVGFLR